MTLNLGVTIRSLSSIQKSTYEKSLLSFLLCLKVNLSYFYRYKLYLSILFSLDVNVLVSFRLSWALESKGTPSKDTRYTLLIPLFLQM